MRQPIANFHYEHEDNEGDVPSPSLIWPYGYVCYTIESVDTHIWISRIMGESFYVEWL